MKDIEFDLTLGLCPDLKWYSFIFFKWMRFKKQYRIFNFV